MIVDITFLIKDFNYNAKQFQTVLRFVMPQLHKKSKTKDRRT